MSTLLTPTVAWHASNGDAGQPLVVLLHGRGSRETEIIGLADYLPGKPAMWPFAPRSQKDPDTHGLPIAA